MKLLFATKDQRDLARVWEPGPPGCAGATPASPTALPAAALNDPTKGAPRRDGSRRTGAHTGGAGAGRATLRPARLPGPSVRPARCEASPAPEAATASARPAPRRGVHARFLCEVSESFCVPPSKGDDSLPPEAGAASAGHAVGLLPVAGGGSSSPRGRTLPRRRRRPPVSLGTRVRVVDAHPQAITLCTLSLPSWY